MRAWRHMLVLGLVAAGLALAGCGGDEEGKPIPTATATALHAQLDNIQGRLDQGSAGACKDILEGPREPNMEQVSELIDAMPDDVDSDVRSALEDSFDNLWELVQDDCDDKAQAEEKARQDREQQQEEEPDTDTETTPTETETDTTPTDTTPTDTTPTTPGEEPLPPEGDGDNGGQVPGNSGGAGTGGGAGAEGL